MSENWNLLDIKQQIFEKVSTCETDVEVRTCIITGMQTMIEKSVEIEETRELLPEEFAVLNESVDWLSLVG